MTEEKVPVRLTVNGKAAEGSVEPRESLAHFLREHLRLTGTHLGCEHGVCGACTIIVDGEAMRSCLIFAVQAEGASVVTVEGITPEEGLNPLQSAFRRHHALQCGFCTSGMLMTATAFLQRNPQPSADEVRDALSGNICRCTGYVPIVEAVIDASRQEKED